MTFFGDLIWRIKATIFRFKRKHKIGINSGKSAALFKVELRNVTNLDISLFDENDVLGVWCFFGDEWSTLLETKFHEMKVRHVPNESAHATIVVYNPEPISRFEIRRQIKLNDSFDNRWVSIYSISNSENEEMLKPGIHTFVTFLSQDIRNALMERYWKDESTSGKI